MKLTRRTALGFPAILRAAAASRPNILFAIADDMSWAATSAPGDPVVRTPSFDRVAERGVLFHNAVCASPGCAPSRAAILTGKHHWQLREAGTHASFFPTDLAVYPSLLAKAGYFAGLTGKGAGPCNWKGSGWKDNPAGPAFGERKLANPPFGVNENDYAGNFSEFLRKRPAGQPFCFWYGCGEPHRIYKKGSGVASGKSLAKVRVPPFLPDSEIVRGDLLDHFVEVEHFDRHLGLMLKTLADANELDNTIVVVTADNGMSFPGSKASMHEYSMHVPLAISWPARAKGGRRVDDMAGFADLAPTFLEAAGIAVPSDMAGRSLLPVLQSSRSGLVDAKRTQAFCGRERHSHARFDNLGYPSRAIRTQDYLYVRNFKPDRWPAGDPDAYFDIDGGPSRDYVVNNRENPAVRPFAEMALGKRPGEQLFDVRKDAGCLRNLAASPGHKDVKTRLSAQLEAELKRTRDPRILGTGDVFESYPRHSAMKPGLGGFSEQGKYNPKYAGSK